MNKSRLEAFSDGVFAIIMTIMVLELKIPKGGHFTDLLPLLPVFLGYVQSFLFIGNYWTNHHHLVHTVKKVSSGILLSNLFLLFCLSLVPFATGWVGETEFEPDAVAVYAVILILPGIGYTILLNAIKKTNVWSDTIKEAMDSSSKKGMFSVLMYAAAIPLAYVNPIWSEILFLATAVMWIIPSKKIEKTFSE